jgi:hypothetical protein
MQNLSKLLEHMLTEAVIVEILPRASQLIELALQRLKNTVSVVFGRLSWVSLLLGLHRVTHTVSVI